ncbi:hypothetical protein C8A00DRAFT_29572 [Chaetomidium leptoderma]|uniref:Tat pathway signal sequence n=1 Tax=Chaetomidium leptoderma TaxID=669021 RepID=A0AAN7A156_9PEZI|nr:hypothetical protein C8A00DRAFT_29572 [Chaetomidium leptoderma]
MANSSTVQYVRLRNLNSHAATPVDDEMPYPKSPIPKKHGRSLRDLMRIFSRKPVLFLSLLLNIVALWRMGSPRTRLDRVLTYSPALPSIENERVVFSSAFGIERSPFQGPPDEENDKLWASLYDFGITRISADEARPMDNKTLPVPDDEGGYVVQLAVFHQLHCLNLIRKGIFEGADMTNADDVMGIEHLDHCIDMLRQSIMCSSDVTPTTFARTSLDTSMKVVAEVVHTCRSFSKVQQWAWNRRIKKQMDKEKVVTDDPLGWGTYTYSP